MRLPLSLVIYLPQRWKDRYIQHVWDTKEDAAIITAFDDATQWIDMSLDVFESDTTIDIADDCIKRLGLYILPQMRQRGLI